MNAFYDEQDFQRLMRTVLVGYQSRLDRMGF